MAASTLKLDTSMINTIANSDNCLPHIPSDLRPKMRNALLENLFAKMEELAKLCEEVDAYFESGGKLE